MNNISILYLEDEEEIRKSYTKILNYKFKSVYDVSNIKDALTIYEDKQPDILLVDISLKDGNGLEFIETIRKSDQNVRVIVLTSHSNLDYLLKATELKLTKYLLKPATRSDLNEALALAIDDIQKYKVTNKKVLNLVDGYIWNFSNKTLINENVEVELTKKEKNVLNYIFLNPDIELTYDMIISNIWDSYDKDHYNSLKTIMTRLRKKIPKEIIKTLYGIGYQYKPQQ